jgi:hypothetical protein
MSGMRAVRRNFSGLERRRMEAAGLLREGAADPNPSGQPNTSRKGSLMGHARQTIGRKMNSR